VYAAAATEHVKPVVEDISREPLTYCAEVAVAVDLLVDSSTSR